MSQQASVTLNTVVYDPDGAKDGRVIWTNRTGGILNSFSMLYQRFLTAVGGLKLTKVNFKLEVPVVATADTTCSCAGTVLRTGMGTIEVSFAPDSTLAERTDFYLRLKDLIASDLVKHAIEDLNPAYA